MSRIKKTCTPDETKRFLDEAKRQNESPESGSHVTKPVVVFEPTSFKLRWQARNDRIAIALDPTTFEPQWRLRRHAVLPAGNAQVTFSSRTAEGLFTPVSHRDGASSRVISRSTHDITFSAATARLIALYDARPSTANQAEVLHLLHRLQVYAASVNLVLVDEKGRTLPQETAAPLALEAATLPPSTMSAEAFASHLQFFGDIEARLTGRGALPLSAEEAAFVLTSLQSLTRTFRELSSTLQDITDKIATKPFTYPGPPADRRTRLAQLVNQGLRKIESLQGAGEAVPESALRQFVLSFIHASRCFMGDGLGLPAQDMALLVEKIVLSLLTLENSDSSPIFFLFEQLSTRVLNDPESGQATTLQALLENDTFQRYLASVRTMPRVAVVSTTLRALLRDERPAIWQLGAHIMMRRCDGEFESHLEDIIKKDGDGSISARKLNYIFALLNNGSSLGPSSPTDPVPFNMDRQTQARYRLFLARLADINGLHALTMAGATPCEVQRTTTNLSALYDISHADLIDLDSFFSNAGYRLREHFIDREALLSGLCTMLRQARSNPVESLDDFTAALDNMSANRHRLPALRDAIFRALGQSSMKLSSPASENTFQRLLPAEKVLQDTIIPSYALVMEIVLTCFPFTWREEHFLTPQIERNRLIMTGDARLFQTRQATDGKFSLQGILDEETSRDIHPSKSYFSAGIWSELMYEGDCLAKSPKVKEAILALAQYCEGLRTLDVDATKRAQLQTLLSRIQLRLQLESRSGFENQSPKARMRDGGDELTGNIAAVNHLLRHMPDFGGAHLRVEGRRRFFRDGELSCYGRTFLGDAFKDASDVAQLEDAVADRLFEDSRKAVDALISTAGTDNLRRSVSEIGSLIERERNIRSFGTEQMVQAFNARHISGEGSRTAVSVSAQRTENLRESLYKESKAALEERKIGYVMPNQALAAELCRRDDLKDKNLLMKMGTGQGKSIVIAVTAMFEAERLSQGEHVFVLTCYDHLARDDHHRGKSFFEPHGIRSICLGNLGDVDKLTPEVSIIYADAKTLQGIAREIISNEILALAEPSKHTSQPQRVAFLHNLFNGQHRFILDEYDLILSDLDQTEGLMMAFPKETINKTFVNDNAKYSPTLHSAELRDLALADRTDARDGQKNKSTNGIYVKHDGEPLYIMRPGALRVSQLLLNAQRIIGLSGSTDGVTFADVCGLRDIQAPYFELPSSSDPDSFGTRLVDKKENMKGLPGIYCVTRESTRGDEKDYLSRLASDVRGAREPRTLSTTGGNVVRPVLIFVDPDNKQLLEKVKTTLAAALPGVPIVEKFKADDLGNDGGINAIGLAGRVTLASIVCGRGIDIHVSQDIPDGMHILVATSLASERLFAQVVGRTGRMGRDGSYSTITLGDLIEVRSENQNIPASENTLHDMTRDLIALLMQRGGCDKERALRWLMLATEQQKGNKELVASLRGDFKCGENAQ